MVKDPEKAQEMIDKFGDFKVPVFINGSIHGNEYPGTDTAMRLIEKFAYDDSPEVMKILQNEHPADQRRARTPTVACWARAPTPTASTSTATSSPSRSPRSRATVKVFTEWNPMIVLDLHGFVNPMLIEPCTPPHNPELRVRPVHQVGPGPGRGHGGRAVRPDRVPGADPIPGRSAGVGRLASDLRADVRHVPRRIRPHA